MHAVLVRCRLNPLSHIDIRTGDAIRRYEHDHPGSLFHIDVKRLGKIAIGGGWRFVGRVEGRKTSAATPGAARNHHNNALIGTRSSTPSSITTPRWPTPRSTTTKPLPPPSGSYVARWGWIAMRGLTVERSCPTAAAPSDPTPGVKPALNRTVDASGRSPTDPRPTADRTVLLRQQNYWVRCGVRQAIRRTGFSALGRCDLPRRRCLGSTQVDRNPG